MPRYWDLDDVMDAEGAEELLGIAQPHAISLYQRRYVDMPRPIIYLSQGRWKLWLRPELKQWLSNCEARDA
jgi:hypothetical protein